jgi:hypothetical protein
MTHLSILVLPIWGWWLQLEVALVGLGGGILHETPDF